MGRHSPLLCQGFSQVGHSLTHIMMLLYPTVVLGLEHEFNMAYGDLLMLMTLGNVLFGLCALPAGWLGDRWSAVGMMTLLFLGMGVSAIATGLSQGPLGLSLGLAAIGVFASIYHPVGMAWLVRNAANRGRALGINGMFGSLGVAAAGLIAGSMTQAYGWRSAFIVPGVVSICIGFALLIAARGGWVTDLRLDIQARQAPSPASMWRAFIVLSLTMMCSGLIFQALSSAMPKILAERAASITGGTPAGAGVWVSVVFLVAVLAQLVGGHMADRGSLRAIYLVTYLLLAPVLLIAGQLVGGPLIGIIMLAVLLSTLSAPLENTLLSHYSPDRWRGTAFGAKFVLAIGVASLAVPMVGLLHKHSGNFASVFVVLALLAALVAVAGLWLPSDRQSESVALVVSKA